MAKQEPTKPVLARLPISIFRELSKLAESERHRPGAQLVIVAERYFAELKKKEVAA